MLPDTGLVGLVLHYKYAIIVLLGIPEGPILSVLGGFLWRLGILSFLPLYISLMAADLIGDVAWYNIGYHWGPKFIGRFGHLFNITEKNVATIERLFHKHKDWVLFVSKITSGFGFAIVTLMTAGLVRIPFRRYMTLNAAGQLIWTGALIGVGYSFGHFYNQIHDLFGRLSILSGFIILGFLLMGFRKYLASKVMDPKKSS